MNNKSFVLLLAFLMICCGIYGQEEQPANPVQEEQMEKEMSFYQNGLTVKALLMDYQSQNGGDIGEIGRYHHGFELGYIRKITDRINIGVPLKVGVVSSESGINELHKTVIGLDLIGQVNLVSSSSPVIPYITVGYGYVYERIGHGLEEVNNLQASAGLGFKLKLEDRAYLNWESQYRYSLSDNRNNLHHGLGFLYFLGPRKVKKKKVRDTSELDSDGDGIIDELDLCPQEAGLETLQGCPDKDEDGVADYLDKCPEVKGLRNMNGCPDTDGDGVSDNEDECPNLVGEKSNRGCPANDADNDGVPNDLDKCPTVPGTISNNGCPEIDTDGDGTPDSIDKCPNQRGVKNAFGCPDLDGDGIPDSEDRCPSTRGTFANNGCPERTQPGQTTTRPGTGTADSDGDGILDNQDRCPTRPGPAVYGGCPDTDGDGIDDSRDRCPTSRGTVDNNGCPPIAQRDLDFLEIAMRSIQFETGKADLKIESYRILRQIAEIMNRYPDYNLSISGHTDAVGTVASNQILSDNRAKACYQFLENAGIIVSRMNYQGYGESQPVADNATISGGALNRRVEFSLIPR